MNDDQNGGQSDDDADDDDKGTAQCENTIIDCFSH